MKLAGVLGISPVVLLLPFTLALRHSRIEQDEAKVSRVCDLGQAPRSRASLVSAPMNSTTRLVETASRIDLVGGRAGEGHVAQPARASVLQRRGAAMGKANPCKCKAQWTYPAEYEHMETKDTGVCAQDFEGCPAKACDGDPEGSWCVVEDPTCDDVKTWESSKGESFKYSYCQAPVPMKATYHYLGCYAITNPSKQFVKPEPRPRRMTVNKCYNFCHEKEKAGEDVQFFVLGFGKYCSCLQYIDKATGGNTEDRCKVPCEGKEGEICGGEENLSAYVMINCAIEEPSASDKVRAEQQAEAFAAAAKLRKKKSA